MAAPASPHGRELDSLADVISFGVAPASSRSRPACGSALDQIILMYFVGCGLSRLARYNVTAEASSTETGKVRYFEGTPIPTSIVPLGLFLLAFHGGSCIRCCWAGSSASREPALPRCPAA